MPESYYIREEDFKDDEIESKDFSVNLTEDMNENDYHSPANTPVSLAWKNLTYEITDRKTKKQRKIIQNVSGLVKPGEFLAIMGPSGAGKSTFLDLLAGRKDPKSVSGQVLLNGKHGDVKYVSTYVMQDDALMGVLTVRENIQFAADLCFPDTLSQVERNAHVQNIISEFGLERVADSKIGTVFVRGISGGEKRRCAIASQVLTLPKVIFLDEPTTGLDSAAAYNVMNSIVTLAKRHQLTVVASIHQPSTETYSLFDKLLLLGHGKTLYFGEREKAITYFEQLGHACPPYNNPADHFLRLVNSDFMRDITEAEQHITKFSVSFSRSNYKSDVDAEIDDLIVKAQLSNSGPITKSTTSRYARGFFAQTFILMRRSLKNATRNVLMFWIRVAMYMCLAILMGTTWWQVGYEQKGIENRFSAHFFSIAFLCFMSVAGIPGFLEERLVFQRERSNGFYSVGPYVLSNTMVSLPFVNVIATSFSVIAYPMIGLHSGLFRFFNFLTFLFLALFVAESMVVFIAAAIPIFVAALAITAFANGFFMVVEGYFVRRDTIPKIWKWAHYLDYQKYSFEAIIKNDFEGLTFNCAKIPDGHGGKICQCSYGGVNATNSCHYTGEDVIRQGYGYDEVNLFHWGLALVALAVAFRVGFYLILLHRKGRN